MREHSVRALRRRESLRRRFRPDRVKWLFVGESPPASGRFFYQCDSGLYRAMRDAFRSVDPEITDATFLTRLRASGCYLIDLCQEPVDDLNPAVRRAACRDSEPSLSRRIARLRPQVIVTLLRSIEENVRTAAGSAGWCGTFFHLPYPGRWSRHRDTFVATLAAQIGVLVRQEVAGASSPANDSDRPRQ
jgi:hypothetical protein